MTPAPRHAANPAPTLEQAMQLIRDGQESAKQRWDDLKADFEAKHNENRERRHALGNKIEQTDGRVHILDGRLSTVEQKIFTVVGDNSGDSGLLHKIDKKVDALQEEIASIKSTVQDTPKINRWVYGAMGVIALLALGGPTMLFIIWELVKFIAKH